MNTLANPTARLVVGFLVGTAIALADNVAFEGEVSPIVIVALLLAATIAFGSMWGRRGWLAAALTWGIVPLVHLVKKLLGLPDTLHPNTYTSILYLAVFTLAISGLGMVVGGLIHRFTFRERKA